MDKEKEIKQLAQLLCCFGNNKNICVNCNSLVESHGCGWAKEAEMIYNAGYRRIIKKELEEQ